jgi:hypothetical protein
MEQHGYNKARGRDVWAKRIQLWRESGLTQAEWCNAFGVSIGSLKNWIDRLNKPLLCANPDCGKPIESSASERREYCDDRCACRARYVRRADRERAAGIDRPHPTPYWKVQRECEHCGTLYTPGHPRAKFCGEECSYLNRLVLEKQRRNHRAMALAGFTPSEPIAAE